MKPQNMVIIMSDEHNRNILGCYGDSIVRTPCLDLLSQNGTTFTNAYCTSPVCVPARASFHTGKYLHQIGHWDNADPYDGGVPSWQHAVRASGGEAVAIGKLHFRSHQDDNGFSKEILTMQVFEELGDLMGLVREDLPRRGGSKKIAEMAGPGTTEYTEYDRTIVAEAEKWLLTDGRKSPDRPWVLMVSFVSPHFPLTVPQEYFNLYPAARMSMPKLYDKSQRPQHPYLRDYAGSFAYDDYFVDEPHVKTALSAYYGLCSFLDDNIARVLTAIDKAGLSGSTRIVYTSDHGDNLGSRGLWGKSTMFEESAAVPLIITGEGFAANARCDALVSHVDFYPFILNATGTPPANDKSDYPGLCFVDTLAGKPRPKPVLAEYHGMGSTTGAFMIRNGRWKYVYYVGYPPQLFDLKSDPDEVHDLGEDLGHAAVRKECHAVLTSCLDPLEVDTRAKKRQAELLAKNGGREAVIARGDLVFSPPPGVQRRLV